MSIRAMATLCFCPPEMVTPRSPMGVSYPWAKPSMASSITAILAYFLTVSRSERLAPSAMLSLKVLLNRKGS